ncbi:MAG: hypothetical protein KA401_00070 [Anaerolineae bacterium]|nr:hypothetical protein [Chloroflexota bacterium]MBP6297713.1 hypothetical protein [Anaerolineae bacterium]
MSLIVFAAMLLGALLQQTPKPTLEPTVTAESSPVEVTAAPEDAPRVFDVLTQEDLSVITGNVQRPNGMLWFAEKLYVICTGDWTVYEVDAITGSTITFISGVRNGHALYVESDADGRPFLWVPDADTSRLLAVTQARAPRAAAENLNSPWGMTFLDEDTFLVTSLGTEELLKVSRGGEVSVVASGFRSPTGVALDETRVYVANSGSSRRAIEWLDREDMDSTAIAEPQPLVRGLQNVSNIVFAPDGYLYFAYAIGTRGVVGRVEPGDCVENGGCDNDQVELVLYTDLSAPLAGLTISSDMRLFVHTLFRPEIYWAQIEG